MTNLERLKMEISDISYTDEQLSVFLLENGLIDDAEYNPASNTNKKNILKTALSILEAIANNPQLMKSYKTEDITITEFSQNLQSRIDQLERKIRMLPDDENVYQDGSSFTYIFSE
ncbi:MAG: hypothetical protein PHO12_08895 [Bacteroidales bacterium]|nr:hypothetical protein [Bacteroidales bacterium]